MNTPKSWRQLAENWSNDNASGASDIVRGCAQTLVAYTEQARPRSVPEIVNSILSIARLILRFHRAMSPVVRLLNDTLLVLENVDNVRGAIDQLRRVCNEYIALVEQANSLVAEQTMSIIPKDGRVITVSRSTAVARSLILAAQHGYHIAVTCLESRPMFEGRALAELLSRAGMDVTLVVDVAGMSEMRNSDLLLTGVDSMTIEGAVNKIGTWMMTLAARSLSVPAYVLGDTSKVWPSRFGPPQVTSHDPAEVWEGRAGIQVKNPYYECTPWHYFSGVLTERGPTPVETIAETSNSITTSQLLADVLGGK